MLLWVDGGDFCPHHPRCARIEDCDLLVYAQRDLDEGGERHG